MSQSLREFVVATLPEERVFADRPSDAELAALPACAAVYLLETAEGAAVLLAHTQNLRRLAQSRFAEAQADAGPDRRTDLAAIVRRIRWREVDSRFEADWRYWRCARRLHARESDKLAPFGPAQYLRLNRSDPIPHPDISERVGQTVAAFIGPFPTRTAANAAYDGLIDLFDLCRYPEQVRRAPRGQRCAYAEMGRCDAPCDGGAPLADYAARVEAAWRFASGGAAAWIEQAERRMGSLAAEMKFEAASLLKSQLEFARKWPRIVGHAELVSDRALLLLVPVLRRRAWKPFCFSDGVLLDGPRIADRKLAEELPAWVREIPARRAAEKAELSDDERTRQHWLIAGFLNHPRSAEAVVLRKSVSEPLDAVVTQLAQSATRKRAEKKATAS